MRQEVVVEIQPDGRAALRIVIVDDGKHRVPIPEVQPDRGVVEIPLYEEPENVITWQM